MNEAGGERGLKEQAFGAARRLVDRLKNGLGGNKEKQPNPADIATAEAALGMSATQAADTLSKVFPDKFTNQAAAASAVTDIGAGINQDNRAAAATQQKVDTFNDAFDNMMSAGQPQEEDPEIADLIARMEQASQAGKNQKP